jgi:hypothetical protein
MATKKKAVSKRAVSPKKTNKLNAPLSQRPYVTIAILAALVCALALTIGMTQGTLSIIR